MLFVKFLVLPIELASGNLIPKRFFGNLEKCWQGKEHFGVEATFALANKTSPSSISLINLFLFHNMLRTNVTMHNLNLSPTCTSHYFWLEFSNFQSQSSWPESAIKFSYHSSSVQGLTRRRWQCCDNMFWDLFWIISRITEPNRTLTQAWQQTCTHNGGLSYNNWNI